jgi:hypothetical protein
MTPQERQLVSDLFDRLAKLETSPRDPEAERLIADGLARAPHAAYALVQTALVQDEALKRADARIRELGGDQAGATGGGFLDSMRDAFGGQTNSGQFSGRTGATSVPSVGVNAANQPDPRWNNGGAFQSNAAPNGAAPQAAQPAPGGSFLGTAAASAVGVIGGALLFNSIGSLFGQRNSGSAFADTPASAASPSPSPSPSPWDNKAAGSDLSRDAGLNDVGGDGRSAGLFDSSGDDFDLSDGGGDFGGDDSV